ALPICRQVVETESGDESGNRTATRISGLGELCEVESAIFDGWRYLGMDAHKVLSFTPREFAIMMRAELERKFDRYEEYSHFALRSEERRVGDDSISGSSAN